MRVSNLHNTSNITPAASATLQNGQNLPSFTGAANVADTPATPSPTASAEYTEEQHVWALKLTSVQKAVCKLLPESLLTSRLVSSLSGYGRAEFRPVEAGRHNNGFKVEYINENEIKSIAGKYQTLIQTLHNEITERNMDVSDRSLDNLYLSGDMTDVILNDEYRDEKLSRYTYVACYNKTVALPDNLPYGIAILGHNETNKSLVLSVVLTHPWTQYRDDNVVQSLIPHDAGEYDFSPYHVNGLSKTLIFEPIVNAIRHTDIDYIIADVLNDKVTAALNSNGFFR